MRGWHAKDDARLRELWEADVSMRRIGLALERSRSTVLYRSRKLGLPLRAQPVMALAGVARVPPPGQPTTSGRGEVVLQREMLPVPGPAGRPKQPLRLWLVPTAPPRECQWPSGEKPRMRFCLAPALAGKPYCVRHCRIAFVGFGRPRGEAGYPWVSP